MPFIYRAVDRLPKTLDNNTVYHSEEFEVAALLCACGCGHRVSLLVPDSHQVYNEGGLATVRPSISVCDAPCKAHYIITAGEVEELQAFSPALARFTMQNQIARHAALATKPLTWRDRILNVAKKALQKFQSFFR
jgi:hypothetical protein